MPFFNQLQLEIASIKVSFTFHFTVPRQLAQYFPNHPWNGHGRSQVLVPRLSGALALSSVSSDAASRYLKPAHRIINGSGACIHGSMTDH